MEVLNAADFEVRVAGGGVELRTKKVGDLTAGWVKIDKGVDLAGATVGLQDDLCQCPHWGYMIKGHVRMKTKDGSKDYKAGEAFYWGPGHAPEAIEDSEYVDYSPTDEFEAVIAHLTRGG